MIPRRPCFPLTRQHATSALPSFTSSSYRSRSMARRHPKLVTESESMNSSVISKRSYNGRERRGWTREGREYKRRAGGVRLRPQVRSWCLGPCWGRGHGSTDACSHRQVSIYAGTTTRPSPTSPRLDSSTPTAYVFKHQKRKQHIRRTNIDWLFLYIYFRLVSGPGWRAETEQRSKKATYRLFDLLTYCTTHERWSSCGWRWPCD